MSKDASLIVRTTEVASVRGPVHTLCWPDGRPLPLQVAVSLRHRVGEPSVLTVEFLIDDEEIVLLPSEPSP